MAKPLKENFIWAINNLSALQPKMRHSDPFLIAGCRWRLLASPKGNNYEFSYQYLGVADSQSLTCTWSRHVKLRFNILHGVPVKPFTVADSDLYFDEKSPTFCSPIVVPPSNLLARDAGFLICGGITIVVQVIGISLSKTEANDDAKSCGFLNNTQQVKESVDINGFQVLPSQVKSVKRIFERYPDIASEVRSTNLHLKSAYMNVLVGIIETLCQWPQKLSYDDLKEASVAVSYVAKGGFKVDWLEKKIEEVKEKKHRIESGKARLLQIEYSLQIAEEKCLELKALVEKEKVDVSSATVPLSFDDVV